jgi:hypothetical protein
LFEQELVVSPETHVQDKTKFVVGRTHDNVRPVMLGRVGRTLVEGVVGAGAVDGRTKRLHAGARNPPLGNDEEPLLVLLIRQGRHKFLYCGSVAGLGQADEGLTVAGGGWDVEDVANGVYGPRTDGAFVAYGAVREYMSPTLGGPVIVPGLVEDTDLVVVERGLWAEIRRLPLPVCFGTHSSGQAPLCAAEGSRVLRRVGGLAVC